MRAAGQGPEAPGSGEGARQSGLLGCPAQPTRPPLYAGESFSRPGTSCLLGLPTPPRRFPASQALRAFRGLPRSARRPPRVPAPPLRGRARREQLLGPTRLQPGAFRTGGRLRAGRGADEPRSAAGRAGSAQTLFGGKSFPFQVCSPSPMLAHTPPARCASACSRDSLEARVPGLEDSDPFALRQDRA